MSTSTELFNWLHGTADGGPNGDGKYPLTGSDGITTLVACPAVSSTGGSGEYTDDLQQYVDQAQAAAQAAQDTAAGISADLASKADLTGATFTGSISATNLSGINTGDQTAITGNAGTATKLETARLINGVAFDGTSDITISGGDGGSSTWGAITGTLADQTDLNTALAGKLDTAGTAASATKLATARTISGTSFNGTANITIPYSGLSDLPVLGTASTQNIGVFATSQQGAKADSALQSVQPGTNITIDNTDPKNPVINGSAGGGGGTWGSITGTLSDQTDLKSALDGKVDAAGGLITGDVNINGSITTSGTITAASAMLNNSVVPSVEVTSTVPTDIGTSANGHVWLIV